MNLQLLLLTLILAIFSMTTVAGDKNEPQVIVKDFKFTPQDITIKRGQTIFWENKEKRQYHSVWFEASGEEEPDYIFPDETYKRKFEQTGTFPYRCGPHPRMIGTVTVKE